MSRKSPRNTTYNALESTVMDEYVARLEKIHARIKADPSEKYRMCEEDNQHPDWEPKMFSARRCPERNIR